MWSINVLFLNIVILEYSTDVTHTTRASVTHTLNTSPACVYNGVQYIQGQKWEDACDYICECMDAKTGMYLCSERFIYSIWCHKFLFAVSNLCSASLSTKTQCLYCQRNKTPSLCFKWCWLHFIGLTNNYKLPCIYGFFFQMC